jgi:hypothetical protein
LSNRLLLRISLLTRASTRAVSGDVLARPTIELTGTELTRREPFGRGGFDLLVSVGSISER